MDGADVTRSMSGFCVHTHLTHKPDHYCYIHFIHDRFNLGLFLGQCRYCTYKLVPEAEGS